jgi:hypothetical protein
MILKLIVKINNNMTIKILKKMKKILINMILI